MAANSQIYEANETLDEIIASSRLVKQLNNKYLSDLLNNLFLEIEHGDEEHRKWLKDKIEDFKQRQLK